MSLRTLFVKNLQKAMSERGPPILLGQTQHGRAEQLQEGQLILLEKRARRDMGRSFAHRTALILGRSQQVGAQSGVQSTDRRIIIRDAGGDRNACAHKNSYARMRRQDVLRDDAARVRI